METTEKYLHLKELELSSNACSSNTGLHSRLPRSSGPSCPLDVGTKRRLITVGFRLIWLRVFTSVDNSKALGRTGTASPGPLKRTNGCNLSWISPILSKFCYKVNVISMGAPVAAPKITSSDVARPSSNFVPEPPGESKRTNPARAAVSAEESKTETQEPNVTTFMYHCAFHSSLRKRW